MTLRIALPFNDDSTLIFARHMRTLLQQSSLPAEVDMVLYEEEYALSDRQLDTLLPEGPDLRLGGSEFIKRTRSTACDAVITSRMYHPLNRLLADPAWRANNNRPCIISFLGGLDFFPEEGFYNRRLADCVYLYPAPAIAAFQTLAGEWNVGAQEVNFGHPSNLTPSPPPEDLARRKDIYFFTQALSPSTQRGRMHILRMLRAIALANPDRTVWIKLRHLPQENSRHKHRERYDYVGLLDKMPGTRPRNLRLTACTMDEALKSVAIGITCTSTAAVDLIRAGIPTMVYLDYVDCYVDPLADPMRRLFHESNLIRSLGDVLHLEVKPPAHEWIEDMFCPRDLGQRVQESITRFHHRGNSNNIRSEVSEVRWP